MKRHFEEVGHKRTKQVTCECGKKFRSGTSGAYYLHRCDDYLPLTRFTKGHYSAFINNSYTIQNLHYITRNLLPKTKYRYNSITFFFIFSFFLTHYQLSHIITSMLTAIFPFHSVQNLLLCLPLAHPHMKTEKIGSIRLQ